MSRLVYFDRLLDYFGIGKGIQPTSAQKAWFSLQSAAARHEAKMLVMDYANALKSEKTLIRDRLAASLQEDIKRYYPHLMNAKVPVNPIRDHAKSHERRCFWLKLSASERKIAKQHFEQVREYLACVSTLKDDWKKMGLSGERFYGNKDKAMNLTQTAANDTSAMMGKRVRAKASQRIAEKMHQLAHDIMANQATYQSALDFYGIHFRPEKDYQLSFDFMDDVNTQRLTRANAAQMYAFKQGDALKAAAKRHTLSQKIALYQKAVTLGDKKTAQTLAHEIMISPKIYAAAIRGATGDIHTRKTLWGWLKTDAKGYDLEKETLFLSTLTDNEKMAHAQLKTYLAAKKAHANAWREIMEARGYDIQLSTEAFQQMASHDIHLYRKDGELFFSLKTPQNKHLRDVPLNTLNLTEAIVSEIHTALNAHKKNLSPLTKMSILEKTTALGYTKESHQHARLFRHIGFEVSQSVPVLENFSHSTYVLVAPQHAEDSPTLFFVSVDVNNPSVSRLDLSDETQNALLGKLFYTPPLRYTLSLKTPPKNMNDETVYLHRDNGEWVYSVKTPYAQEIRGLPVNSLKLDQKALIALEKYREGKQETITDHHLKNSLLQATNALHYTNDNATAKPKNLEKLADRQLDTIRKIAHHVPPEKALTEKLTRFSFTYTLEKNRLGNAIANHLPLFEKSLAYFHLTPDSFQQAVADEKALKTVEAYIKAETRLEKGAIAITITRDPKSHGAFIHHQGVDWERVYQDAEIYRHKKWFDTLTFPEKKLHLLGRHYRNANQTVGKLWGKISHLPYKARPPELLKKISDAVDLRNKRAHTILTHLHASASIHVNSYHRLQDKHLIHPDNLLELFCLDHRLNAEKLRANAEKHQTTLAQIPIVSVKKDLQPKLSTKKTPSFVKFTPKRSPEIDLARLKADLNDQAERVLTHYLGQPKKRQGREWRYDNSLLSHGADGSFSVTVHGKGQGLWNDFRGSHGNLFSLIQRRIGGDFKKTLHEATDFLGGQSRYLLNAPANVIDIAAYQKRQAEKLAKEKIALDKKIAHVQSIASGTVPIKGTLAEKYLAEHRGIQGELNSENLRFHPALKNWSNGQTYPALVVLAHDADGKLSGLQATFLDPTTANKAHFTEGNNKLSRGIIAQGSVVHQAITENKQPTIALAEGLETALSVACVHPDWEVRLTFGVSNFERAIKHAHEQQPNATYVLCQDNDGLDSGTDKAVKKAVDNLSQQGIKVQVVEPEKPDHIEKWDFNDQLKKQGLEAVRADLDKVLSTMAGTDNNTTTKVQPIHEKNDHTPLTPEKEKEYKGFLKHYQALRRLSEETNQESDRAELRRYSHKLIEQGKFLMKYAEKNYPLISKNIRDFAKEHTRLQTLSPEKEEKYKNHIKKYQLLKNAYEKSNDSSSHDALIEFSNKLTTGEVFMQYIYTNYPKVCQSIQDDSKVSINKYQTYHKNQEQDRDIDR